MEMPRLNIRQTLPQIGVRQTQCKMEMTTTKAEVHTTYQPPKSVGWTQPKTETNSYESRKVLGARNNEDYAAERAQEGVAKLRENISKHNSDAQAIITRGARKGSKIMAELAKNIIASECQPPAGVEMIIPPNPTIESQRSETSGKMDPGSYDISVKPAEPFAHGKFTPAHAETYMKQEGSIDRWITYGEYDRLV